jgi:hypothetical protein
LFYCFSVCNVCFFLKEADCFDVLGKELGLSEFTPPYYAPSTSGPKVLKGVNYASGASGILNDTGALFVSTIYFCIQMILIRRYIMSNYGTSLHRISAADVES